MVIDFEKCVQNLQEMMAKDSPIKNYRVDGRKWIYF